MNERNSPPSGVAATGPLAGRDGSLFRASLAGELRGTLLLLGLFAFVVATALVLARLAGRA